MNKKTLIKYAEMKDFQKAYNSQVKDQEGSVMKLLKNEKLDSIKLESVGSFSLITYKTWKYSPEATKVEAQLKLLQEIERQNGYAKVVGETEGVRFTASKESHVQ